MTDFIKVEERGFIQILTIDRPAVRNALSLPVLVELRDALKMLQEHNKVRVLVITGAQDQAFSAGADLKERQGMSEKEALKFVETIQAVFQEVATLPIPTIAAINGHAFGGGLELALACDMRVMSIHALAGLTECSLGIIPGAGGTQRLPRLIGLSKAMDLIFSARRVTADEALLLGLVNYLAKDAAHTKAMATEIATKIAGNAPLAVRAAKVALLLSQEKSLLDGLVSELASYHEIIHTEDRREGLRAFQEKRAPRFHGS